MKKSTKEQSAKQSESKERRQINAIDYFFNVPITYPNSIVSRKSKELRATAKTIIYFLANQEKDDEALSQHCNKSTLYFNHIRDNVAHVKAEDKFVLQNLLALYEQRASIMGYPSMSTIEIIWHNPQN